MDKGYTRHVLNCYISGMKRFNLPIHETPMFRSVIPNGVYHRIADTCLAKYPVSVQVEGNDIVVRMISNGVKIAYIEPWLEKKLYCVNVPNLMYRENKITSDDWSTWLDYALPVAAKYKQFDLSTKIEMLPSEDLHTNLCGTYTIAVYEKSIDDIIAALLRMIDGYMASVDEFFNFVQGAIGSMDKWLDKPSPIVITDGELGEMVDALTYAHEIANSGALITDVLKAGRNAED